MRISIDETLMEIAWVWSRRGTCSRLQVGSVIAKDTRIISSGYNGAPSGIVPCDHTNSEAPCEIAAHAEENAIVFAAKAGISTEGTTMYCTHLPCARCARLIINAGIKEVVYQESYRSTSGKDLLEAVYIRVRQL